jgi:hypothetical protein
MANVKIRGLPTFSDDFTNESTDFLVITESGAETANTPRTSKISINKLKQYIELEDQDGDTKFSVHTGDNTASITCDGLTPVIVNKSGININPLNLSAPINYGLGVFTSDGVKLPAGSSAQRPAPTNGLIRYNTDISSFEGYINGVWQSFGAVSALGPENSIQYNSGSGFQGASNLIYQDEQLSGASGFFEDFKVTGNLAVGGNLYVTGETFVQSVTDVSVTGDISGYTINGTSGSFTDSLKVSGFSVLTGVETGNFITTGQTGDFVTTGLTGDFVTTGLTGDFVTTGLTGDFVTTGLTGDFVTTGLTGDFITTGQTGDFVTTGLTGDFITTGQTGDFVTTGLTGDFITTGQTGDFVTTGLTGDFITTGQTGDFVTTGLTGDFITTGQTGDFVTTGLTGDFITTGQTGDFVTTGLTGDFITTGQTGDFVTTGLTGDFVTTGLTGDFITTGQTGDFVTTGLTGDFVTTGLTGDFVTTGLTGDFITTGQTGDFVTTGLTGDFVTTDLLTGISDADNDTYITTEETADLDSICFYTSGNKSVEIDAGGDLLCYNDVVAYYSSSDQRLKENIQTIDNPINKIEQINGVSFDWKEEMQPKYSGKDYGVLAQEVELILPEAVKDKENGFKSVKYNSIIPLLIECVKDQEKRIKELEKICQSKA